MSAPNLTEEALSAAVEANVPVLLWGAPGIGKTSKLTQLADSWQRHIEVVSGAIREPTDFLGLPIEDHGKVTYSPPAWAQNLAAATSGLLFLDELTTAPPSVQKAMLRILQERVAGELRLPDSVAIVAAANPPEIAVDGWDLPAPLSNRMMHLDYTLDVDSWLSGMTTGFKAPTAVAPGLRADSPARKAKVAGSITGYLRNHREMVLDLPADAARAGRGWPSPRSWDNAARVLSCTPEHRDDLQMVVLTGCVGEGAAIEYMAWLAAADLYDPEDVLNDPQIVDWDSRPDRIFALTGSIVSLATSNPKLWTKAVNVHTACAAAGHPDLAWAGMGALLEHAPVGAEVPPAAARAFSGIMVRLGRWAA